MSRRGTFVEGAEQALPADRYDVVIVGAGVYGLCLGYELRQLRPDATILIVEDNTIPGEGITVNTGGIVRSCYSNRDVAIASAFGQPYFADPTRTMRLQTPAHTGFVPSGWARVVNDVATPGIASELARIVATAEDLRIPGVWTATRSDWLARMDAARAENIRRLLDVDDVTHVLVDEHGGYADGGTTLLAFLTACLEHGVDVVTQCTVRGFVRVGGDVSGIRVERWRRGGDGAGADGRRVVYEGEVACDTVVVAAGAGSRRLIEREFDLRMPTLPTYHQTPMVENTASVGFTERSYARTGRDASGSSRTFEVHTVDVPVISHWRDLYFHAEGSGITVGAHHRELHDEDYIPQGGVIGDGADGIEVGLSQVLVDKILEHLDHFPALAGDGLRLGRRPTDVPGGFYVMNPEELPFEGPVPGTNERVHYIGSGSGTGFKLGPGLARLLAQRLSGVPRGQRLVTGDTLSVERNRYFYPAETTDAELRALFDPEFGRFRHMGASGIVADSTRAAT